MMEEDNKLIQEKYLLDVFEKYSDLQSNTKKETNDILMSKLNHILFVLNTIGSKKIWMSILHTIFDKNDEEEIIQYFQMQKI